MKHYDFTLDGLMKYLVIAFVATILALIALVSFPTDGKCQMIPMPGAPGTGGNVGCVTMTITPPGEPPKMCTVCYGAGGTIVSMTCF